MVLDRTEPWELAKVDQMRVRAGPALQEPRGFPHLAEPVHARHRRRGHETAVRSQEVVERCRDQGLRKCLDVELGLLAFHESECIQRHHAARLD